MAAAPFSPLRSFANALRPFVLKADAHKPAHLTVATFSCPSNSIIVLLLFGVGKSPYALASGRWGGLTGCDARRRARLWPFEAF